jgi:hypothetical protein
MLNATVGVQVNPETIPEVVETAGESFADSSAIELVFCSTVNRGPSAKLFSETRQLVETYVGVSSAEAALVTAWNATTWFADILPNPPALFLHGSDMSLAITLFRLLRCIGRHPLILTEIGRAALCSLMALRPTFLIETAPTNVRRSGPGAVHQRLGSDDHRDR